MTPSSAPDDSHFDSALRLAAARGGSLDDLGVLFQAARPFLMRIAHEELSPTLRGKADGSDLVQQTFLEAQQSFADFRGGSLADFVAWLRGILKHNIADFQRRYLDVQKRAADRERPLPDDIVDPEDTPSRRAAKQEEAAAVEAALVRLPEDYRVVLQLRHREHLTFAEIAALLGRSEDAAQKLWARAVECLRGELGVGR